MPVAQVFGSSGFRLSTWHLSKCFVLPMEQQTPTEMEQAQTRIALLENRVGRLEAALEAVVHTHQLAFDDIVFRTKRCIYLYIYIYTYTYIYIYIVDSIS